MNDHHGQRRTAYRAGNSRSTTLFPLSTVHHPRFATLASALIVTALPIRARCQQDDARARVVVSTEWLADHLNDPKLVLLHVGTPESYAKEHIRGARFVTLNDIAAPMHHDGSKELMLQMPETDSLRAALARFGISDDSRIIVYFGNDADAWVSPSTRLILTLDYAGLGDHTSLLDGGLAAWIHAGKPVTAEATPDRAGKLTPLHIKAADVASGDWVRDNKDKPGYSLVDARAAVFYDGVNDGGPPTAHRKGHIPGAKSVPFTTVMNDDNTLKPAAELAALFKNAGVKPGDTVIGYCHIGQQATAMLFAARSLGFKAVLYDGSFEDWAYHDWPVEVPPRKGGF